MITEQDNLSPDEVMGSLRRVPVFKGLSDDELQTLLETLKGIKAAPGDLLFEEGDEDAREVVERVQQAIRGAKEVYPDNATVLFLRRH